MVVTCLLLMPDHVHLLVRAGEQPDLAQVVFAWKRYTARQFGIRWQRDFFDRRLRSDESFAQKADYILQNPVRAGLVDDPRGWPYVWRNSR
jgi:putative transposase